VENTLLNNRASGNVAVKLLPYALLLIGFLIVPIYTGSTYWRGIWIAVMFRIVGAVGLRTIFLSGNLTFAHGAFIALGAYCTGVLARQFGLPPIITLPAGAVFASLLSVLTGLPFVRLRGMYYAMSTMFFGVFIVTVIQIFPSITGGVRGMIMIPPLTRNILNTYYIFVALTTLSLIAMYRFEHSRIGVTLRAIGQSPDVAASIGINETFYKLLAIGFGSFFAGLLGGAYALYLTILSPLSFGMLFSISFIMCMFIGGEKSFLGPVIGAILLTLLPEIGRGIGPYAPLLTAVAMLIVAYLIPNGLAGLPGFIIGKIRNSRSKKAPQPEER